MNRLLFILALGVVIAGCGIAGPDSDEGHEVWITVVPGPGAVEYLRHNSFMYTIASSAPVILYRDSAPRWSTEPEGRPLVFRTTWWLGACDGIHLHLVTTHLSPKRVVIPLPGCGEHLVDLDRVGDEWVWTVRPGRLVGTRLPIGSP